MMKLKFSILLMNLFLLGCSSLLYYPEKGQLYDPHKLKLTYEDVYFRNRENQKIHAWWFASRIQPSKGTFVYFHGNAENLSSHFISMSWLPGEGYNYLIFDYPGYGQSEGSPDPYHNVISGSAALEWVHQNKDPRPLIVYGQSMGSIVSMRSVIEKKGDIPIRAVVVDGAFSSFQEMGRQKMAEFWLTWIFQPFAYIGFSDKWAPDVSQISPIPLVIIHGEHDPIVDISHGERVFKEAKEPKVFIRVPEGHHGDLFWVAGQKYRRIVFDEIEKGERKK